MIGKNVLKIDASSFLRGSSTSAYLADGGFSPETDAVNLAVTPGTVYPQASHTDLSSSVTGDIIAFGDDANVSGNDKYAVDDEGHFYTINGSTVTVRQTDAGRTYQYGTTDTATYRNYFYASSQTDVAECQGSDLGTFDADWWSTRGGSAVLNSSVRHPLLVFEDNLFIGDGAYLHRWNGTTASQKVLDLSNSTSATSPSITALTINPGDGKMLISISIRPNYSAIPGTQSKILVYDGFSNKPSRSVIVDGYISAMYPCGGTIFVFYDNKVGYWTGTSVVYLRTFTTLTHGNFLRYKHSITSIDNNLYFINGRQIMCFGNVNNGSKVFYPAAYNQADSNSYQAIGSSSSYTLLLSRQTEKLASLDTMSVAANGGMSFYTNKFDFERPVYIRNAYLEFKDAIGDNVNLGSLALIDETGTVTSFSTLLNSSGASVYYINTNDTGKKVRSAQFRLNHDTGVFGLKRIIIPFDVAE